MVLLIFAGALGLWFGVPVGWLWIGSRVQGATGSLGAAIGTMIAGLAVTIPLALALLVWLNDRHRGIQLALGREDTGRFVLETALVIAAMIALTGFVVWFFVFAGASPVPFYGKGT